MKYTFKLFISIFMLNFLFQISGSFAQSKTLAQLDINSIKTHLRYADDQGTNMSRFVFENLKIDVSKNTITFEEDCYNWGDVLCDSNLQNRVIKTFKMSPVIIKKITPHPNDEFEKRVSVTGTVTPAALKCAQGYCN